MADEPASPRGPHRHAVRVLEASTLADLAREIERTASEPEGVGLMVPKGRIYPVRVDDVPLKAAPLLKQELLAVGGDSAHARGIADHSLPSSPAVLLATWGQYRRLWPKLARQPFSLKEIGEEVERALRAFQQRSPRTVPGAHRSFRVGDRPRVMGIINVTPDSFSDGGVHLAPDDALAAARRMVAEGADLIDIGGESTRPGATPVSPEAEWARIGPVIARLGAETPVAISVDTRHPEVATRAVDAGADVVNDVEGLRAEGMRRVVERSGAAAIVLHMRGTPETMQRDTAYEDVRDEVFRWLAARTDEALAEGIAGEKLLVDPGLGFGKSPEQSLELLRHAGEFRSLGYPLVLGASRKSFLGWALGGAGVADRLEAGLAAAVLAADRGVEIVRVHEVGPTVRALALVAATRRSARAPTDGADDLGPPADPD